MNIVSPLSPREIEVMNLVKLGRMDKEIALELGIAHSTVKHHMTHILEALSALSRAHAVYICLRDGIINFENST